MSEKYWILLLSLGLVSALSPAPHRSSEESLRGALDAVTRKQRSLSASGQAYYATDAYREPANERRQQVAAAEEDNDESLAFMPSAEGQLETIGDGYQHLNNKQFDRALMDYLQYTTTDQERSSPAQSIFRERERSSSRKRAGNLGSGRLNAQELNRLILDGQLEEDQGQLDDEEYRTIVKTLGGGSAGDDIDDRLLLRELLGEVEREAELASRYATPSAERRNVNARYPLFNREYGRELYKRLPLSKRSAKAANKKRQVTDPKVAQDLSTLFGTPAATVDNHTHDHDHDAHRAKSYEDHEEHGASSVKSKGLQANSAKTKERSIQVKKKSIDWSQYFGIDRRKKKTVYTGKPELRDQDSEYLLKKYYEIMAENLNSAEKDGEAKRDNLQKMDTKLKNMKNLMIEEAVRLGSKNNMDDQVVKDEIMSRLAAAYSLEKLRRAFSEINSEAAMHRESQKVAQIQNNLTANHPSDASLLIRNDKRNRNSVDQQLGIENSCPQMDIVERRCMATEALIGDYKQVLHVPCVLYHICNSCGQDECLERFAVEVENICQEEDSNESSWSKMHCIRAAMELPRNPPAMSASTICQMNDDDSCLSRYQSRYHHRYSYKSPYGSSSRDRYYYDFTSKSR